MHLPFVKRPGPARMGRKEGHYSIVMKAGLALYADREAAFNRHPDHTAQGRRGKYRARETGEGLCNSLHAGPRVVGVRCGCKQVARPTCSFSPKLPDFHNLCVILAQCQDQLLNRRTLGGRLAGLPEPVLRKAAGAPLQ